MKNRKGGAGCKTGHKTEGLAGDGSGDAKVEYPEFKLGTESGDLI
jgi:hypothetical protein